jgi:hypothetical protein
MVPERPVSHISQQSGTDHSDSDEADDRNDDPDYRPKKRKRAETDAAPPGLGDVSGPSARQKKAYWTYLVKRWFPGFYEAAMGSEQMRLREVTRAFLVSKLGHDGGLFIPEPLYQAFKERVQAYRSLALSPVT